MAKRKHREGQSLHRVLGVPALFSTAYGNVGSSIYYALGVVAASALGLTPVVFMLTGLLFVTTAFSYAEATTMYPEAGGSSSFARHTFNEFVSFGAGWALMLDYIITIAISAFFVPNYLAAFWPILKTPHYATIGGIVTIALLVAINIIGIKEAARLNIVLAILDLATQVLLAVVGLFVFLSPKILISQIHLGVAPTWHQLIYGISIGTVAYTGIETISNMAEESSNPGRDVPRAVNYVLAAVLGVYFAISMVGLSAMTVHPNVLPVDPQTRLILPTAAQLKPGAHAGGPYVLTSDPKQAVYVLVDHDTLQISPIVSGHPELRLKATGPVYQLPTAQSGLPPGTWVTQLWGTQLGNVYIADPLQGIVQNLPDKLSWLKVILSPWIALLAATILIIGTNAGIIGSSRLAYSMAGHKQLPPILSRVHPRRMTPYVAIAVFGLIAALLLIPGSITALADLYAFGAMISFTVAHVCVVALRFKKPDFERPWRTPLNIPFRGKSIPLTAVLGGLGTATVWVVVVLTHALGRTVGISWMAAGILVYVIYRKRQGFPLLETVKVVPLPQAVSTDILYDQMLVPIVGSRITDEMVVLACQLATEKQSAIDVMYVIEVPMNLPLDARLATERARAKAVLEAAQVIADQFDIEMRPVVVTARAAGRAIVEEARTRRSEVVILGSHRKRRIANRVFGGTVEYVLVHAPCEVLVNLVPYEYPTEGFVESEAARSRVVRAAPRGGDEDVDAEAPDDDSAGTRDNETEDAPNGAEQ
jgi:amino acid transporter/nucleotide-binding universal stress UspA family protein